MYNTRLLIDTSGMPTYVAEYLEKFLLANSAYIISAERYTKLIRDEKVLDHISTREVPAE